MRVPKDSILASHGSHPCLDPFLAFQDLLSPAFFIKQAELDNSALPFQL